MPDSTLENVISTPATAAGPPPRIQRLVVHRGAAPGLDRIEVHAGNGLVGYGEGCWGEDVLPSAPEILIGRSPFEAEAIFEDVTARSGRTPGGLDIAVWDAAARSLGMPLCRLLGKTYRTEVRVCAIPPGGPLRIDGVEFSEEVVAAGQTIVLDVLLRDFVQSRLIDLALPELASCGLTGLRRLAYYCWVFRVRPAVRCAGSRIAVAAALHGAACFVPVTRAIAAPPPFIVVPVGALAIGVDRLPVPAGPGLGVEPEPERTKPLLVLGES
jgi:L-alanine-DL-glutamate epimerase-like enolase superfamily enzyme